MWRYRGYDCGYTYFNPSGPCVVPVEVATVNVFIPSCIGLVQFEDLLFFGGGTTACLCYDINLQQKWLKHLPWSEYDVPMVLALAADGHPVYWHGRRLAKLNRIDGSTMWSHVILDTANMWNRGAYDGDTNRAFICYDTIDNRTYIDCVSASDGSLVYRAWVPRTDANSCGDLQACEQLYKSNAYCIQKINKANGDRIWTHIPNVSPHDYMGISLKAQDAVRLYCVVRSMYQYTQYERLYCLDKNGNLVWQTPPVPGYGAPVVFIIDDYYVYYSSFYSTVLSKYNKFNGSLVQSKDYGRYLSTGAKGGNRLIIVTYDGEYYRVHIQPDDLSQSPLWSQTISNYRYEADQFLVDDNGIWYYLEAGDTSRLHKAVVPIVIGLSPKVNVKIIGLCDQKRINPVILDMMSGRE